jgi:hypothetical protein
MFLVTVLEYFETEAISRNCSRSGLGIFDDFLGENVGIEEVADSLSARL